MVAIEGGGRNGTGGVAHQGGGFVVVRRQGGTAPVDGRRRGWPGELRLDEKLLWDLRERREEWCEELSPCAGGKQWAGSDGGVYRLHADG
jgi:hypothetical protein